MEGAHLGGMAGTGRGVSAATSGIRQLMRGLTVFRCALFIGNVAVVLYMLYVIRENRRERQKAASDSAEA